jgi:predicted GNAT superfamily acetyltransferase
MRWTFDPLVRRNVAFNLNALGARAVAFYPDFYGVMTDSINAADASDRLEARWDLAHPLPTSAHPRPAGSQGPAGSVVLRDRDGWPEVAGEPRPDGLLEVPVHYESVRTTEPERARAWRLALRGVLTAAYGAGLRIGNVVDQGYRLVPDREEGR